LHGLFSTDLSEGTLTNITDSYSDFLQEPLEQIRKQLEQAPVANFDETGSSIDGKRQWLQAACSPNLKSLRLINLL